MAQEETKPLKAEDVTVAWICALERELVAIKASFDEIVEGPATQDRYVFGKVRGRNGYHNVVAAATKEPGTHKAARLATTLYHEFKELKYHFFSGIAGGIPSSKNDVRLGDLVVGMSVISYDYIKTRQDGMEVECSKYGIEVGHVMNSILQEMREESLKDEISGHLKAMEKNLRARGYRHEFPWQYPGVENDRLFEPDYEHRKGSTCEKCDEEKLQQRKDREDPQLPTIHYGTIACANNVMKSSEHRDVLHKQVRKDKPLCLEMEATGVLEGFNTCLIVRGVCDYADSHKNDIWQDYAAAIAAAYIREVLKRKEVHIIENRNRDEGSVDLSRIESTTRPIFSAEASSISWTAEQRLTGKDESTKVERRSSTIEILEAYSDSAVVAKRYLKVGTGDNSWTCWLPQDNVKVAQDPETDATVRAKWSSCNQPQPFSKGFTKYYKPHLRKVPVSGTMIWIDELEKLISADAKDLVNILLEPYKPMPTAKSVKHAEGTIYLYHVPDDAENRPPKSDNLLGLLNEYSDANFRSLYFAGDEISFTLNRVSSVWSLNMRMLWHLDYISRDSSEPNMENLLSKIKDEDGPSDVQYVQSASEKQALSIRFDSKNELEVFFNLVTGWKLVFCNTVPSISIKSGLLKPADEHENRVVMVWRRSKPNQDVEIRLASYTEDDGPIWWTATFKDCKIDHTPGHLQIELHDGDLAQGDYLDRRTMTVACKNGEVRTLRSVIIKFKDKRE